MTDGTRFPATMRYECLACGREFEATGRARMFRRYCDNVCSRWANRETGRRIMAERTVDPPIPEDVYRRFPILGALAESDGAALAAWHMNCDCNRCAIHRAANRPPLPVKPPRRRPQINTALGPRYPCGHPRTIANSYPTGNSSACIACNSAATKSRRRLERLS